MEEEMVEQERWKVIFLLTNPQTDDGAVTNA